MSRRDDRRSPRSSHQSVSHSARYSDWVGADLMSGDISIEADCDFEGGPILVDDEDLNAAFEAEHGGMFKIIDEVKVEASRKHGSRERGNEKKNFVIPKVKRPEHEDPYDKSCSSGEEGKRDWRRSERDTRPRDHDNRRRDRGDRDSGWRERDVKEDTRQRESQDSRGESGRQHAETKREPWNGSSDITSTGSGSRERQSLFESFSQQGLISDDHRTVKVESAAEVTRPDQTALKNSSHLPEEEESGLMIPLGRDSLVFVRDYHSWQVRVHPVCKMDMARSDFAQIWSIADSSSVVWSTHKEFGGVAEFLLKDYNSIQKFMRKIMWHNYAADVLTVEVTEREKSDFSEQDAANAFDTIANKMMFKFNNTRARQMIKTFYPTPQGEVTDRSVYVNNVNSGKAASLLKAVFPCSSKISVARSTAETSSALVETCSVEETFNYLVVYDQICINNSDVILSSVQNDWKGAKEKFEKEGVKKEAAGKKAADSPKPSPRDSESSPAGKRPANTSAKRPQAVTGGKRPADAGHRQSANTASGAGGGGVGPAKRSKGFTSQGRSQEAGRGRDRGGAPASRGGPSRGRGGRGGAPGMGRHPGRPLLPDPNTPKRGGEGLLPLPGPPPPPPPPDSSMLGGMGDGLLPHPDILPGQPPPLLGVPVNPTSKGLMEGELMGPPESDYHSLELKEIQHQLESRVMETRAQLETHLSKLDHAYMAGLPPKPRRPMDYLEDQEAGRDAYRRPLLPGEGAPLLADRQDWRAEPDDYRRPMPPPPPVPPLPPPSSSSGLLPRGYDSVSAHSRPRREEDYADAGQGRPRPYLLEAPPEQGGVLREGGDKREVYDYDHARRHQGGDSDMYREDRLPPPPPTRPALLERDRRDYPGDRSYGSCDQYSSYEEAESRRAPGYRYEEDNRRAVAPRYDDYDRRY